MNITEFDQKHLWHPYAAINQPRPCLEIVSAAGCILKTAAGEDLIDGMASWWCAVHGYNHPRLNQALATQLAKVAHVMFGGLTHQPAVALGETLLALTPPKLQHVFFADSGSVAVEVAIKMALQYWQQRGQNGKQHLLTARGGYHGDTTGAMAVSDPDNGMHGRFGHILPQHFFAPRPAPEFDQEFVPAASDSMLALLRENHAKIAAIIIEPIVQGAGGMRFYHPEYLKRLAAAAKECDVLLIADEIATGFWRSGKMFACEYANLEPDIMCLGKALSGGYLTLAAVLASSEVAKGVGALMHGPTFMANPLACAVAHESVKMLGSETAKVVENIEANLKRHLFKCRELPGVAAVRVLGAIGVVEMRDSVDVGRWQDFLRTRGVWLRPFGKLLYMMPPYIISPRQLETVCQAVYDGICHFAPARG